MHQRCYISLCKILSRYSLHQFSKPTSPFCSKLITQFSNRHSFSNSPSKPNIVIPQFCLQWNPISLSFLRKYSRGGGGGVETDKVVDEINFKFAEAREEIEMAMECKETVYFDDEAEYARAVVKEVLDMYEGLLAKLPENEKGTVQRSMGLKIEQLKAELEQLNE